MRNLGGDYILSISLILRSSDLCTKPDFVKFRFLLVDFFVKIWLLKACLRLILPVPVIENLFFANDLVLTLGIYMDLLITYFLTAATFGTKKTIIRLPSNLGGCSTFEYSSNS